MLLLSIVAQYNKPNKPKNHTNTSVYYLLFVKWKFVFTLRNSGPAKTGPAGPIPTPLGHVKKQNGHLLLFCQHVRIYSA